MSSIPSIAKNKGEWSEIYVLFKLFVEPRIPAADSELIPISNKEYTFLRVYREDNIGKRLEYDLEKADQVEILSSEGERLKVISTVGLKPKTERIFEEIRKKQTSTFELPHALSLMDDYLITKVKAKSSDKTDLLAEVANVAGSSKEPLGFSIKSKIGGASTLVNASSHTVFTYEISGFTGDVEEVRKIDGVGRIKRTISALLEGGATISFSGIASQTYTSNLQYIDTVFPQILSEMVLKYYSGEGTRSGDLASKVALSSSLNISEEQICYKIKSFLRASALGMVPAKHWDTNLTAYGGYIVVKEDGSLVCYHLHNDDAFKDYLFDQTFFDTPSSKNGGKCGLIYQKGEKWLIDLNLQIRFKK